MSLSVDDQLHNTQQMLADINLTATSSEDNKDRKTPTLLTLPLELLGDIAIVVRELDLESLASLNVCSKRLYRISLPILWKEVIWRNNTWNNVQSQGSNPSGWQFVEYIYFTGDTPWFWEGLVSTLPAEERELGSEVLVNSRWPALRAVFRTETWIDVEVPKSVWITLRSISDNPSQAGSPLSHIIKHTYKAWNLSHPTPHLNPTFVCPYQVMDYGAVKAHSLEGDSTKGSDNQEKPAAPNPSSTIVASTAMQQFDSTLDAAMQVDAFPLKRRLEIHLLSNPLKTDQYSRLTRADIIWDLFQQLRRHFAPSSLSLGIPAFYLLQVLPWLMIAGSTDEHVQVQPPSPPPYVVEVGVRAPHSFPDLLSDVCKMQQYMEWLFDLISFKSNKDVTVILPLRLEVTTSYHPTLPRPSRMHAVIDLKSAETRKVALLSNYYPGGSDTKGYRDGQQMTSSELAAWKNQMQFSDSQVTHAARSDYRENEEDDTAEGD
ncbi:hypothetical protein QFC22_004891 [Naganishia vaughanmartiniae]|uniref:Uncharacterized protein n=1 Tax=Naganishia vaughanmartiniae TaxID=1424756 RepID=A0ACC2WZ52_9TREE|nr:hypothetical protein QFC22_004891 [Naganishia vaughanmartiniae]